MKRNIAFIIISGAVLIASVYFIVTLIPQFLAKIDSKSGLEKIPLAPDFVLANLSGGKIKLSDLRGKKVVILFWTSWNHISASQMNMLNAYAAHYAASDLEILAVNSQETAEAIRGIAAPDNASFHTLLDVDGEVGNEYGISVVPLTVFVDEAGLKVGSVLGPLTQKEFDDRIVALSK